jgi:hypothetical protein
MFDDFTACASCLLGKLFEKNHGWPPGWQWAM